MLPELLPAQGSTQEGISAFTASDERLGVELLSVLSHNSPLIRRLQRLRTLASPTPREPRPRTPLGIRSIRLTESEQLELIAAYQAGASVYTLADSFKICRQQVSAILQRHSVPRRYNQLSSEQIEEARRLKQVGWTVVQLAEHFNLPPSTVQYNLSRVTAIE